MQCSGAWPAARLRIDFADMIFEEPGEAKRCVEDAGCIEFRSSEVPKQDAGESGEAELSFADFMEVRAWDVASPQSNCGSARSSFSSAEQTWPL